MSTMIRAVALTAALIAGFSPAIAQGPTFPQTLPANTVVGRLGVSAGPTEQIPLSRFVTNLPLASGKIWVGNSNGFAAPTSDPAIMSLTINPPAGTTTHGLTVNQTLPSSGTTPGPVVLNSINVTNPGLSTTGSGWDAFGQTQNQIIGLKINYATTGAGTTNNAAFAASNMVTAASDAYGSLGATIANANLGSHYLWGHIGAIGVWPGASAGMVIGLDGEVGIAAGGSAVYRFGVGADSQGPVQGSTLDSAFAAFASSTTVPGGGTVTGWQHLMSIAKNAYFSGVSPIAPTGDFFYSDAAMTVAHFANLPNVTVTGNILDFPNMAISGGGAAVFGKPKSALPGNGVTITAPSSGYTLISSTPNGTTGFSGIEIHDTSTNNGLVTGAIEASNTTTRFGQAAANWGQSVSFGSTNAGLMTGTLTAVPYVIGTNNVARITVTGAGVTTIAGNTGIGGSTAPDATLTVNTNSGATVAPNVTNGLHLVAPDAADGGIVSDSFAHQSIFNSRYAGGTRAAKTAAGAGVAYAGLYGQAWNGSAYVSGAGLEFLTFNAQTGSDSSHTARLRLVQSGSTALTTVVSWKAGGVIGTTSTDQGLGTLNVDSNYYVANTLLKNVTETLTNKTISGASNTLTVRIANDVSGLGTGIATALAVNTGSAGAPVLLNGAGGTPSSLTLTNATGLPVSSITGVGQLSNVLGGDVNLNNTANYFDGPSIAQGTTGTWWVAGTVSLTGTAGDSFYCKLWDGTTVIASAQTSSPGSATTSVSLAGFLASPAANIKISCRDPTTTAGKIVFNGSGNSKDSVLSAHRIQ